MSTQIEKVQDWYIKNKTVRSLMQLLGHLTFGATSAIDSWLVIKWQEICSERSKVFFNELDNGNIQLTEELIQNEDFLHAFFITVKVALNTRRHEKIRLFGKILKSYSIQQNDISIDAYEEYLEVLDELSIREFRALALFEEYYNAAKTDTSEEQDSLIVKEFWEQYLEQLISEFEVSKDEIVAILTRTQRTGCYRFFLSIWGGNPDGRGCTTEIFRKIQYFINQNNIE